MAVNDLYVLKVVGSLFGQTTINRFYYIETREHVGPPSAETTLEDRFHTIVMPAWRPCVSSDWKHSSTSVQRVKPAPLLEATVITHGQPADQGTRSPDALPPQAAAVIKWHTGFAGRANRGRSYLAGIAEADHTGGIISSAVVLAALNVLKDSLLAQLGLILFGEWDPVVRSLRLNGAPRDIALRKTAGSVRSIIYTQRRRTVGVGV